MRDDLVGVDGWNTVWDKANEISIPIGLRFPRLRFASHQLLKVLRDYISGTNKVALEVGCGGGIWMTLFQNELGLRVIGIDYSPVGCKLAKQRLKWASLSENVIWGDAAFSPFRHESFDVVYSMGVIEHLTEPTDLLLKMGLLLKPDGKLVVSVPNLTGFIGKLHKIADKSLYDRHIPYTLGDIVDICIDVGIIIEFAGYVGTLYLAGPNWDSLFRSKVIGKLFRHFITVIELILTFPLRVMNISIESSCLSAFILVIGHKDKDIVA